MRKTAVIRERVESRICIECDKEWTFFFCHGCDKRVNCRSQVAGFTWCIECSYKCSICRLVMNPIEYEIHGQNCQSYHCEICRDELIGSRQWIEEHKYNHELENQQIPETENQYFLGWGYQYYPSEPLSSNIEANTIEPIKDEEIISQIEQPPKSPEYLMPCSWPK